MKVLNTKQTQHVAGGLFVYPIMWFLEELVVAGLKDLFRGDLEDLGRIENRPTGTRP